jgi:DME family drug/metabolite transporter
VATLMRGLRGVDPIWLSALSNLAGSLTLGAWMLATAGSIPIPTASQSLALVAFGVIQMAVPYALFARGLRDVAAPEAALIALVEPVLNPVWVVIVHHEVPSRATMIGGLFLLAGLAYRSWPTRPVASEREASGGPGEQDGRSTVTSDERRRSAITAVPRTEE